MDFRGHYPYTFDKELLIEKFKATYSRIQLSNTVTLYSDPSLLNIQWEVKMTPGLALKEFIIQ